ncbi:MAG TPA: hypothetical protein VJT75_01080 [Thermoleophilaceae bacterium]|nr:hypothetical protein [Thermoleophilaceae bacterium]
MGRKCVWILAACLAAAALATPAAAAPRQVGTLSFTSTVPGTVTGSVLDVHFQNPDNPSLKPYAASRMVIHMPTGARMDTTVPPQCHATDAEIYALGFDACPEETRIGQGLAESDNGNGTTSKTTLRHFNNQDEVVGVGQNNDIPVIRTIDRTRIEGDTTTSNFPLFPGVPPPEPYTPVKDLDITIEPYGTNERPYARTPPTCPANGSWKFKIDFTYRDGVTETLVSRSPCVR